MMAITLWPEWAHAVAHLGKRIENRTWKPGVTFTHKTLAIHAGASIGGRPGAKAMYEGLDGLISMANRAEKRLDITVLTKGKAARVMVRATDTDHFWEQGVLTTSNSDLCLGGPEIATRAVVAVVTLSGYVERSDDPWFVGPYGWQLDDVKRLVNPLPIKRGKQGLWALNPEQAHDVRARMVAA